MKVPASIASPSQHGRPLLPRLTGQALAAAQDELAGGPLEGVGVDALLAPLGDAPEPVVVADRPEGGDLAAERAGDRLEQLGGGLVEAVCLGDRARDAVLRLKPRGESRSELAQAGDHTRELPPMRSTAVATKCLSLAEGVVHDRPIGTEITTARR